MYEMKKHFEDEESPFEIVYDRDLDGYTKTTKKVLEEQCRDIAGPGEVECVCYANASGVNFVVFDVKLKKSWEYFRDNGYINVLKLSHCTEYE